MMTNDSAGLLDNNYYCRISLQLDLSSSAKLTKSSSLNWSPCSWKVSFNWSHVGNYRPTLSTALAWLQLYTLEFFGKIVTIIISVVVFLSLDCPGSQVFSISSCRNAFGFFLLFFFNGLFSAQVCSNFIRVARTLLVDGIFGWIFNGQPSIGYCHAFRHIMSFCFCSHTYTVTLNSMFNGVVVSCLDTTKEIFVDISISSSGDSLSNHWTLLSVVVIVRLW